MGSQAHDEFLRQTLPSLDLVYNLARRMVSAQQVEDLVQETYLRAFEAWQQGRKPRKVEPWIATICLNTGRSWLRRAHLRHEYASGDPPEGQAASTEEEAMERMRALLVHEAMWKLPEEQRIALALMDLDGFSASQVARMTGAPRGTVLTRVHRARKRLALLLDKEVIHRDP
jgi:RNA polymerase sigma-70 factor (ECF subfamily)